MKSHLKQGDCIEIMSQMPADSVDLVFGSPPYEDARDLIEDPFPVMKGQDWVDWMVRVYVESLRICKGLVAFVTQGRTKDYRWSVVPCLLAADLHRMGICIRDFIIYYRVGIPGSGGPDWLRHDCEYILCATNGGKLPWSDNTAMGTSPKYGPGGAPAHRLRSGIRVNARKTITSGYKKGDVLTQVKDYYPPKKTNPGNIIKCTIGGGKMGSKLAHKNEAPFAESLARFMILTFCPPKSIVLDPFCGSGTTCAVAKREGRRYIGIDIRESQIKLTKRRLEEVMPMR